MMDDGNPIAMWWDAITDRDDPTFAGLMFLFTPVWVPVLGTAWVVGKLLHRIFRRRL